MPTTHIIGAGLAGLSAATSLAAAGRAVTLHEAAPQCGGRARSYFDAQIGLTIDNGNHLVLSGNRAVMDYLGRIGATNRLAGPAEALFPWIDLASGARWTVHPSAGRIPWWLLQPSRRVPGTRPADYLALARLLRARPDQSVADVIPPHGVLWDRLLAPFLVSALNTPPAEASAALAGAIVRESLALGGAASAPRIATPTLAAAFVDPAIAYLEAHGATVHTGARLRALETAGGRVTALAFAANTIPVDATDSVILAVPAWVAADLFPGLQTPTEHNAILNAHFAAAPPPGAPLLTGCVNGVTDWVFTHADRISVTVSAADYLLEVPREEIAATIWAETCAALGLPPMPMPPHRLVIEKRATFAATPRQDALRPPAATPFRNLFLAGDWTETKLPATIEGAIRSGCGAAALALHCGNA